MDKQSNFKSKTPLSEPLTNQTEHTHSYLTFLLENLYGLEQSPKFHPERDTLYHSLQVFQCALKDTNNPKLWTAALLHDVGKAIDYQDHARVGAEQLEGLVHPDIVWLIAHHLDLLKTPQKIRKRLKGTRKLNELEMLRKWDLKGRKTNVEVMEIEDTLKILSPHFGEIIVQQAPAIPGPQYEKK